MGSHVVRTLVLSVALGVLAVPAAGAGNRSERHEAFASELWDYLQHNAHDKWPSPDAAVELRFGPVLKGSVKQTWDRTAATSNGEFPRHSLIVSQFRSATGETTGILVWLRGKDGFDSKNEDWCWVYYLPDATAVQTSADKNPNGKRGFVTIKVDGRWWVFEVTSPDLAQFLKAGELAKHVIRPGPVRLG